MHGSNSNTNLINTERLKDIFKIDDLTDKYKEYIPLRDTRAGFEVKREYPKKIRYKPPQARDGKPDRVALIQVVLILPKKEEKRKRDKRIPVFVSIHLFSRYLSKHFDYDFDNTDCQDCPTKESIEKSKSTPRPLDLQSFDEYVYDTESNTLQTIRGKEVSGEKILDTVFEEHCNTIHLLKGLKFRVKLGIRNFLVSICGFNINFMIWVLRNLFGRTLESAESSRGTLTAYRREDLKLLKTEAFDLFGYRASKNVILVFSTFAILIYLITLIAKIKFLRNMTSNNLIVVCCAIVSLWILDHPVPLIILFFLNLLILLRRWLLFIRIKI